MDVAAHRPDEDDALGAVRAEAAVPCTEGDRHQRAPSRSRWGRPVRRWRRQRPEGQPLTPLMVVVSAVLVAFDFQNLLSWWHGRLIKRAEYGTTDYTIVVPLFGHPRYFDGRSQIECYRDRVLVALEVTSLEMEAFADQLEGEGWRVCRLRIAHPNPANLMRAALAAVTTTYALRLDADTHLDSGLDRMIAGVAVSDADLCSVKVEADEPRTTAAK